MGSKTQLYAGGATTTGSYRGVHLCSSPVIIFRFFFFLKNLGIRPSIIPKPLQIFLILHLDGFLSGMS
jgi:hypothetical protein